MTDFAVLRAFQYFDCNFTGYLKTKDLETILHCLGYYFSHSYVRHLVQKAADSDYKRLFYKKLTEKQVTGPVAAANNIYSSSEHS